MSAGLGVGVNQALFYNSATYNSPVWVEITAARDVTLGLGKSKAEVKARLSTWKQTMPAIKEAPLTFDLIKDTSLAPYNVLRDAHINDTLVDLAVCDQAAIANSGCDYFRADYYLYGFSDAQKLEEVEVVSVEADLAYSAHVPAWSDVA